jgi:diguanylate cyclase (GGDEF)-like protein/PAS domain S-box-containing protein
MALPALEHDATSTDVAGASEQAATELARLRRELAESRAREATLSARCIQNEIYRDVVENLPSGAVFVFDADLRFVAAAGPDLYESVGLRKHEIEGRTLQQVTAPELLPLLEPMYRDTLEGRSNRVEVRRAGRVFDVRAVPIRDGRGAVVAGLVKSYDVTERYEEAARLRTVTAQLAILLDHLSAGVVFSDKHGSVQIVNRAMGTLLGMSNPAELVGTSTDDIGQAARFDDAESVARLVRQRTLARVPVIGDRLHLKTGRILERDYLPLEMRGAFGGDLWCFRDVTDRERVRTQLAEQANSLRELSMRDELTRLNNRRGFMVLGEQQIKLADRANRPVAVFFCDLNGMKAINDRYGHDEGDRALLDATRILQHTFRDSDVMARLGGDEFVVLATDCPVANIPAVRDRLLAALDLFNADPTRRYTLSMSIGVVAYHPPHGSPRTIEELLVEADDRMYEAKSQTYRSTVPRPMPLSERFTRPPPSSSEARWPSTRPGRLSAFSGDIAKEGA